MNRFLSLTLNCVVLVSFLVATDRHAWAYVDPGSGLFILQGFASVTAAVTYFFRRRIVALFGRGKAKPEANDQHKAV